MKKSILSPSIIAASLLILLIPSVCLCTQEIACNGYFVAYDNGVVKDMRTGLEWVVGPDKNTNWNDARAWVQGLSIPGGGWRMPTIGELKTLYDKGKGDRNMTPILKTTGWEVWSGETKGSSSAWYVRFGFLGVYVGWYSRGIAYMGRAFAVRSR